MTTWIEPQPVDVPDSLVAAVGGHPLVARTLARRGHGDVQSARAFLDPGHYKPAPPSDLPDLDLAVRRLEQAIQDRELICVWGDFDVDGQTATTLLVSALRQLGAQVMYHIPVRAQEGHGVGVPALRGILDRGAGLILTCDTGIAAHEAIGYARARGVDVLVTDHHDLPPALPPAVALVNPKRLPGDHPLATLPGVGVAYKLAEALLGRTGQGAAARALQDLVALGIVADLAVQAGDTRYLLQRGLEVLRANRRLGLQVLLQLAEVNPAWLSEEHVAFQVAPRLNALGRLADANLAVEFLTTQDLSRTRVLANQLEGLNARRKLLTDQVFQGALAQVERDPSLLEHAALVLAHPAWPAGVIGIVASRLVERYHRPVVLLSSPPGELARGSARSVEGCNITAAIAAHRDLLAGYGGHPMAAGLTLDPDHIPAFRRALSRTVQAELGAIALEPALPVDGYLSLHELTLDLVADLERLAPFGPGNPPLVLASRGLTLTRHRRVGRGDEHLLLSVKDGEGHEQQVIWWQGAGWPLPAGRFDLAYAVRASTYRGQRDVQVEWIDARPWEEAGAGPTEPAFEVMDYRGEARPEALARALQGEAGVQLWCEAAAKAALGGRDRNELAAGPVLAIWTTPPGRAELKAALKQVKPGKVVLFAVDPGTDQVEPFVQRLAGLAKHVLSAAAGRTTFSWLAAATAQRQAAVRLGLRWLAARGFLLIVAEEEGDGVELRAGGQPAQAALPELAAQLQAILAESAAYRRHFAQADAETLLR